MNPVPGSGFGAGPGPFGPAAAAAAGAAEAGGVASASSPENDASFGHGASFQQPGAPAPSSTSVSASAHSGPSSNPKLRSCVTCRARKVRCDKASPCSNCRRANIACVFPPAASDRPPRWARRLERLASDAKVAQDADRDVNQVMDRLRGLERLVQELTGQLEQARASAGSHDVSAVNSPASSTQDRSTAGDDTAGVQKQIGRLVLKDTGRTHYVSSDFWSRVNDELDGLKADTQGLEGEGYESSGDEQDSLGKSLSPPTHELDRTPSERQSFLFGHNLSGPTPDLREFHPLPSQIPFLINVFSENVNTIVQVVHVPTIDKMIRDLRGNLSGLSPANEALMFAVYYAAITSMEDEDITNNFGASKSDLNLKYRVGLEHALAKADFLANPDLALVQATTIFLLLVRRHDSPRFVWMMTGLVIRMAQGLGLHRDGSHFAHLTPYQVEMRRRVWWALLMLDSRASEDQGTELTIGRDSFDTRVPANINDADIATDTAQMPPEREGQTDMTIALVSCGWCELARQMAFKDAEPTIEGQRQWLSDALERLEKKHLEYQVGDDQHLVKWVMVNVARLVAAKMTLILYFPMLISAAPGASSSAAAAAAAGAGALLSEEIREKLFIAALEVAEYNHALNDRQECRQWRWVFQTYTHWYAIIYLLMAATAGPWTPVVERAWVALHSTWLVPTHAEAHKNLHVWVPLRKLVAGARRRRDAELDRLRRDPQAVQALLARDRAALIPRSHGPVPEDADAAEWFRERWYRLVTAPPDERMQTGSARHSPGASLPQTHTGSGAAARPAEAGGFPAPQGPFGSRVLDAMNTPPSQGSAGQPTSLSYHSLLAENDARAVTQGSDLSSWLWADSNPSMDVFTNMDTDPGAFDMDIDGNVDWAMLLQSAMDMGPSTEQPNM